MHDVRTYGGHVDQIMKDDECGVQKDEVRMSRRTKERTTDKCKRE